MKRNLEVLHGARSSECNTQQNGQPAQQFVQQPVQCTSLKSLAHKVLERNKGGNNCATFPQEPCNSPCDTSGQGAASQPLPVAGSKERGRQALARMAREFDHALEDLLDWYREDLEDAGTMPIEYVREFVADYVSRREEYRTAPSKSR